MRGANRIAAAALLAGATACVTSQRPTFTEKNGAKEFAEPTACWRAPLTTRVEGRRIFVDDDWFVSNWRARQWRTETEFAPQRPRDARKDAWAHENENESLVLQHRRTGATMKLVSIAARPTTAELALEVLLSRRIDAMRGTWSTWAAFAYAGHASGAEVHRRFAVRQSTFDTSTVGGRPAVGATLDFIDLDHLEVDPEAVMRRVRLVVGRGALNQDDRTQLLEDDEWRTSLFVATLSAPAAYFDGHLAEMQALLGKVVFEEGGGDDERFRGCAPPPPAGEESAPPAR